MIPNGKFYPPTGRPGGGQSQRGIREFNANSAVPIEILASSKMVNNNQLTEYEMTRMTNTKNFK